MNWIQSHWLSLLLIVWAVLWTASNAVITSAPTSKLARAAHVFLGISPLDIAKAYSAAKGTLGPLALLAIVFVSAPFVQACGAGTPTPVQQAEVAADEGSQLSCVKINATKAAIDGCRNAIKNYWCGDGGALHDAGACSYSLPIVDGGGQ